jgi:hypothetical protein
MWLRWLMSILEDGVTTVLPLEKGAGWLTVGFSVMVTTRFP